MRRPASRTTANASGSRSSSVSPVGEPLAELGGLAAQLLVGERLDLGFVGVDLGDDRPEALQLALVRVPMTFARSVSTIIGGCR